MIGKNAPSRLRRPAAFGRSVAFAVWICCTVLMLPPRMRAEEKGFPPELEQPWRTFQESVRKSDVEGLARISHFPIRSNDFGGNIASEKILQERFKKIFFHPVRTCVDTKKPTRIEGFPGYILDCDNDNLALGFGFERFGNEYRFSYIDNANAE